jgi:hypothetical protein
MSMSVADLLIVLPRALQHQELGGAQLHRHVRELEAHALKLADLLAELHAIHGPLLRQLERPLRAAQAGGRHLQAGAPSQSLATSKPRCTSPKTADFGTRQLLNSRMLLV